MRTAVSGQAVAARAAGAACLLGFLSLGGHQSQSKERFEAVLTPAKEVPATESDARGNVLLTLGRGAVAYEVTLAAISHVTTVHVHVPPTGTEAPATVLLYRGPETGAVDGVLTTGAFTAKDLTGIKWDPFIAALRGGRVYVEVHTRAFAGGEIRGVLQPHS